MGARNATSASEGSKRAMGFGFACAGRAGGAAATATAAVSSLWLSITMLSPYITEARASGTALLALNFPLL